MTLFLRSMVPEPHAILDAVMALPVMHPRKRPTPEAAAKASLSVIEGFVIAFIRDELHEQVTDVYDMYTLSNGERSDSTDPDDWDSGIDDQVESLLEPYQDALSADWLGRKTINTRLDEENAIDKFVKTVGEEVFKQLSDKKSPNQTLSACGILLADIETALAAHLGAAQPSEEPMLNDENINADLSAVLDKLFAHIGAEYDEKAVRGDVEMMMDMDDVDGILANGAAGRIGLDETDVFTFQMVNLDHPEDALDTVMAQLKKRKSGAAPVRERKPAIIPGDKLLDLKAITLIKAHSGTTDTDAAKAVGVSRTAWTNWANGLNEFRPNDEQTAAMRAILVTDINGLLQALAILDGSEQPMAVS